MNYADKMAQEARLMGRLASWMEQHGQILYCYKDRLINSPSVVLIS